MELSDKNFLLYAAHFYDMDRAASTEEFEEDLKRFQYVKRLLKRFHDGKELKTRLILNHIIVIYNCFGPNATHMLFLRLWEFREYLKPFVLFLNYMPIHVKFNEKIVHESDIKMNETIIRELRKI